MLPDVIINHTNGALGGVPDSQDGIAALVLTGVTAPGLDLATPKVVYSLADVNALGIDAESDNAAAYRHIKEFYDGIRFISGREVAELYIMLVANTVTLTQMADVTNTTTGAKRVIDYAQGRVRHLGLARTPDGAYTPTLTDGIDADCLAALPKANELGETYKTANRPLRVSVEGRSFLLANIGDLKDLKTYSYPRANIVLWSTQNDGSASVGFTLGVKAALPVQRKISRVKNGLLGFSAAYVGDTTIQDLQAAIGTIHDKGYILLRTFPSRSGYYFTGEPMAAPNANDYAIWSRGNVIDKAHRIAYDVFLEEIDDDVEVDTTTGQLAEGYVAYLENRIITAIKLQMADAISGLPEFTILPNQNILATGETKATLKITPKGYMEKIVIDLGFQNPA